MKTKAIFFSEEKMENLIIRHHHQNDIIVHIRMPHGEWEPCCVVHQCRKPPSGDILFIRSTLCCCGRLDALSNDTAGLLHSR